jgi:putative transcriptional regulator
MSKTATTGKRVLRDDGWYDDNGLIPVTPDLWDPPMTDDEINVAASADPDALPSTPEQLRRMRAVSPARFIRQKLSLSVEEFATAYAIPVATLRAWERHELEPTVVELAYLHAIGRMPDALRKTAA